MISGLATDKPKRELLAKLAEHYKALAVEVERAIKQREGVVVGWSSMRRSSPAFTPSPRLRYSSGPMDAQTKPTKPFETQCQRCGSSLRILRALLDSRTGRTVRLDECKCGKRVWDD